VDKRPDVRIGDDGAVFAPTRIRARGRPPILLAIAALTVGGLIAVGLFDGLRGDASSAVLETGASPTTRTEAARPRPPRSDRSTLVPPSTLPAALIALDLRPAGSHLFVHGDVFSVNVIVVTVSLEDAEGNVSETRSARLPGGSTAFRTGPNPRFDVRFDVPDELMGEGLFVRANAYDFRGRIIGSFRSPVVRPSNVVLGAPREADFGLLDAPARGAP
jgi:hypothetical protein